MNRPRFSLAGLLSLASFGLIRRMAKPVEHQDKAALDIFSPDPARPRRAAKKSGGGRNCRRHRSPHYHAWKKCFGGLAVSPYIG